MEEFPQNLLKNSTVRIYMNEEEKEIQKALGLFKKYDGYIRAQGTSYYDVYEVQDVTLKGAKLQMGKILTKLQQKSKVLLTLHFVQENVYSAEDEIRRDNIHLLKIRRHKCHP